MSADAHPNKTSIWIEPETRARIEDLGRAWGPVEPLSRGKVIAEAIKRAWEAEAKTNGKRRGKR